MSYMFTHEEYRQLLRRTRDCYPIRGFDVLDDGWSEDSRFAILRHDIDISPSRARDLAAVEAEENVQSTYTILLTSDFYNPLEPRTRDVLRQIAELGHELGLHFDAQWHSADNESDVEAAVKWQSGILEKALGVPIRCFSFHNTTPFTMACHRSHYGGLRNAYAGRLQSDVRYTSDSNGTWRFRSWEQLLDEGCPRIQVLTHADWWTAQPLAPAQKICMEIEERSRDVWHHYCELLEGGGKTNGCDIADILPALRQLEPDAVRLWLSGYPLEAISLVARRAASRGSAPEPALERARELLMKHFGGTEPLDSEAARNALVELAARPAGPTNR